MGKAEDGENKCSWIYGRRELCAAPCSGAQGFCQSRRMGTGNVMVGLCPDRLYCPGSGH